MDYSTMLSWAGISPETASQLSEDQMKIISSLADYRMNNYNTTGQYNPIKSVDDINSLIDAVSNDSAIANKYKLDLDVGMTNFKNDLNYIKETKSIADENRKEQLRQEALSEARTQQQNQRELGAMGLSESSYAGGVGNREASYESGVIKSYNNAQKVANLDNAQNLRNLGQSTELKYGTKNLTDWGGVPDYKTIASDLGKDVAGTFNEGKNTDIANRANTIQTNEIKNAGNELNFYNTRAKNAIPTPSK